MFSRVAMLLTKARMMNCGIAVDGYSKKVGEKLGPEIPYQRVFFHLDSPFSLRTVGLQQATPRHTLRTYFEGPTLGE